MFPSARQEPCLPFFNRLTGDQRVCVTILDGIRKAVHPSLSKSRRFLGERQGSADKHDAQDPSTMRKRESFQTHSLARRACLGTNILQTLA